MTNAQKRSRSPRAQRAATATVVDVPATPTRLWQAAVPSLPAIEGPADTAQRLLLLLHYAIDWENSWVADERYRKKYWDELLPGRVRRAAYQSSSLDHWWSAISTQLDAPAPRQRDRRLELACLLREPPLPVIAELREHLPALILRVRIIAEAVAEQRKAVET